MAMNSPKNKRGPVADINVTPLVDVMLVLLVIFMISAPLMFNGINLKLPKTKKVSTLKLNTQQVVLSVTPAEEFFIGDTKILMTELLPEVLALFEKYKTQTLFVRADYELSYGKVARLISYLKRGGVENISLVTEIEKDK